MGLSVYGLCLLLLSGCAVPGGYDINTLHLQPESGLVYPGSTDIHTNNYGGSPGNYVSKGAVAVTGESATTVHTQLEVLAYFSQILAANGWRKIQDNDRVTTPAGLPAHFIQWDKSSLHLYYLVDVWAEGEATKYYTQLQSDQ
jgi:hypothetical protein